MAGNMQHNSIKEAGGPPSASILRRLYPEITTVKASESRVGTNSVSTTSTADTHLTAPSTQDVLLKLVGGTPLETQLQGVLIQPGDPAGYRDGILLRCLCSVHATAPTLRSRFTLQQHSSQAEVSITVLHGHQMQWQCARVMAVCRATADPQQGDKGHTALAAWAEECAVPWVPQGTSIGWPDASNICAELFLKLCILQMSTAQHTHHAFT